MGTNYYLKLNITPQQAILYACTKHIWYEDENFISRLNNGFVWRSTYYSDLEALEKEYEYLIHIGKNSVGWHFSLCIYPDLNINNLEDWKELFNSCTIIDENYKVIKPEEMLSIINKEYYKERPLQEESELKSINDLNAKLGHRIYDSYDDLLKDNSAERGFYGLWAHKYGDFTRTDGAYDLTTNWEFS